MRLRSLVVADPVDSLARQIADGCERLADERVVVGTSEAVLAYARTHKPDMIILSLELTNPDAVDVASGLRHELPATFIVVSFRELAVPTMERLARLGVDDFIAQPIDLTVVFRAASRHFGVAFRRHDRHGVAIDVLRADGVLIGRTIDLSEGGMRMRAFHPVVVGDSLFVDLAIEAGKPIRVRCRVLEVEGQPPIPVAIRAQFENLRGRERERMIAYTNRLAHESKERD